MSHGKMRRILGCFIFLTIMISSPLLATTYYIDATNGNDFNNGISPEGAWKTWDKVRSPGFTYQPGDTIKFKCGETWNAGGNSWNLDDSGSSGNLITITSYGSGKKPIITGWTDYHGSIWTEETGVGTNIWSTLETDQVWRCQLDGQDSGVPSAASGIDGSTYLWYWGSSKLYIYATQNPNNEYSTIEAINDDNYAIIVLKGSYIKINGLRLEGAEHSIVGSPDFVTDHITITNCDVWRQSYHAIWAPKYAGSANHANSWTITNNDIDFKCNYISHSIASTEKFGAGSADGIYAKNEGDDWYVANNTIMGAQHSGMQIIVENSSAAQGCNNHIWENNVVDGTGSGYCRGINVGGPSNGTCSGHVFRYNVEKNCTVRSQIGGKTSKYYYNLFYDKTECPYTNKNSIEEGVSFETIGGVSDGNEFYNNVIYNTYDVGIKISSSSDCKNNLIKNNIIANCGVGNSNLQIEVRSGHAASNVFQYNCIYDENTSNTIDYEGTVCTVSYCNSNSDFFNNISFDPLFIDDTINDFHLKLGSPCVDLGTDVGLTQDYDGNTVPYGWGVDIGAYELQEMSSPFNVIINASLTSGYVPLAVDFTSSVSGGTSPYSYSWDFGDGNTSSEQNPSHTYINAGEYTVILTVTDSTTNQASDSLIITAIESASPLSISASASPTSGQVPLSVSFTASVSGGTSPYSYSWNFGDGSTSSQQNPSHTYNNAGQYTVTLTVTDSNNSQASDSLTITGTSNPTYNLAISAVTGSPAPGEGGTTDPSPGNHSYSSGNFVQVNAIDNENYRFSKWTGDVISSDLYNNEITISMDKDKAISAHFFTECGDVNGDLSVSPADAQAAFNIYLGRISNPTESEKENADVNCDGTITSPNVTPADAHAIFEKYIGKNDLPCDCSCNSRSSTSSIQAVQARDANLISGDIHGKKGEEIIVLIYVDKSFPIKAFGFDLLYPSELLEFVGVERTGAMNDFLQVDANKIAEGVLRAGGYAGTSMGNLTNRVLIKLIFRVIEEIKEETSLSIINFVDDVRRAYYKKENISKKFRIN